VEADGGARGNPGPAGYGAVVRDAGTGEVLGERSASLGVATNNVAEYSGLIAGLEAAAQLGAREVEVRMDSKLVVEQMSGRWQIKHPGLRPLAAQAAALAKPAMGAAAGIEAARTDAGRKAEHPPRSWSERVPASVRQPGWEPPTGARTRMLLVRHGETELTAGRRYSGRGEVPLTERGTAQARALALRLAGMDVAAIV